MIGGDGDVLINAVGAVEAACADDVTFVSDEKHKADVANTNAAAVIVGERIEGLTKPQLLVEKVDLALIEALTVFALNTNVGGSGDILVAELNGETLSLDVNGSGNLRIEGGQVNDQEIDINGSGNYAAGDLLSEIADVRIGGSGNVTIWVTESLDIRINGSGNVRYYGQPAVSSSGNGSGDVVSLGDK